MSVIKLTPHYSGAIRVEPASYLGNTFRTYISVCKKSGAIYKEEKGEKFQLAKAEVLPVLVNALKDEDFKLDIHPDVVSAVQALAQRAAADKSATTERLKKVNEALAAKGKYLFPFQVEDITVMSQRTAHMNANPMGSGKTVETLLSCPENEHILVVCPAVAKGVWARETEKWRLDEPSIEVLKGMQDDIYLREDVTIMNYSIMPPVEVIVDWNPPEGTVLIADEAHLLKNPKALRTQRFREMAQRVFKNKGRVYLLTGTPMLNRPLELWNVLQAADLHLEAFGSWNNFTKMFNAWKDQYSWVWGEPSEEVPEVLNRVMIRHEKEDILSDLPPKRMQYIEVDRLNRKALKVAANWKEIRQKIQETADGASFEELSEARAALATAKIPAMLDFVKDYEEQGEPLIVASAHRAPIDVLKDRDGWEVITGSTSPEERTRIEKEFQAGGLLGIGLTIKAGGVAITLTRASHMLFVDEEWTPALNEQCRDRIHRIGQNNACLYMVLVANHWLDKHIAQLLIEKNSIIQSSINEAGRRHSDDRTEAANEYADLLHTVINEEKPVVEDRKKNRRKATTEEDYMVIGYMERRVEKWGTEFFVSLLNQHSGPGLTEKQWEAAYRSYEREDDYTLRPPDKPREPKCAADLWVVRGLDTLTYMDPDGARDRNDMGFNAFDSKWGHDLNAQFVRFGVLSEDQWNEAKTRLRKYKRQIGEMPTDENEQETNSTL